MPGITPIISRTSTLLASQNALSRIQETQRGVFEAQDQITTGRAINRPSDAAAKVSSVLYLQNLLAERGQQRKNLDSSANFLNFADQGLADANNILTEAQSIASSQVGVGSDSQTRDAQATVIDSKIEALLEIVNRQFNGLSVFGGNNGAAPNGRVFEPFLGGIRYLGSSEDLTTDVGSFENQVFTANGLAAFGGLSARVKTTVDLLPGATAATRLADIGGALGAGFRKGTVNVNVNGTVASVDLTTADSLGDVVTRINDAITNIAPGAGSLAVSAAGFTLTGVGGNTVTITDPTGGLTAADLGIDGATSTGGVPTVGGDVGIKITPATTFASLGAALDLASGLVITQGTESRTLDLSTATTVQDAQNLVQGLGIGLRLEINAAGNGLDLVSEVAGLELSIGENGGTTAESLGLRTFGLATKLDTFRHGLGVVAQPGKDDARLTLHDGTTFDVNFDGATTVGELITAINTAAAGAGVTLGTGPGQFNVSLATTGNGLVLNDNTAGASGFEFRQLNESQAVVHLGFDLVNNIGAGTTLTGADNATARVENLFTHLRDLSGSLRDNDTPGITIAGGKIEEDIERAISARATVGVQGKRLEDTRTRTEDQTLTEQNMLGTLIDADLTEVISRYQQLQLQLRASMQVTAQSLQLNLFDFLR